MAFGQGGATRCDFLVFRCLSGSRDADRNNCGRRAEGVSEWTAVNGQHLESLVRLRGAGLCLTRYQSVLDVCTLGIWLFCTLRICLCWQHHHQIPKSAAFVQMKKTLCLNTFDKRTWVVRTKFKSQLVYIRSGDEEAPRKDSCTDSHSR